MAAELPTWPMDDSTEGRSFFTSAREIFSIWKSYGVSVPFAVGMLANAEAVSSLEPRTIKLRRDGTTAFHLHQWSTDRCRNIKRDARIDLIGTARAGTATVKEGVEAAHWELNGPIWKARLAIECQHSAFTAAYQACALFQRDAAPDEAARRGTMAERWTLWLTKNGH